MSKMMVSEEMKNAPAAPSPLRRLLCWEGFLLAVTLAVFMEILDKQSFLVLH